MVDAMGCAMNGLHALDLVFIRRWYVCRSVCHWPRWVRFRDCRRRHCHINELEPPFSSLFPEFGGRPTGTLRVSESRAANSRPLHYITTPLRDDNATHCPSACCETSSPVSSSGPN